jgi:hypothetical protein
MEVEHSDIQTFIRYPTAYIDVHRLHNMPPINWCIVRLPKHTAEEENPVYLLKSESVFSLNVAS